MIFAEEEESGDEEYQPEYGEYVEFQRPWDE